MKPRIYRAGPVILIRGDLSYLVIGNRLFCLTRPFVILGAAWAKVRAVFPSFWAIGLHDCDSGGGVFEWHVDFAWNDWHLHRTVEPRWDGAGDGETWHRISAFQYLRHRGKAVRV